ncbi:MAG: sulfite exporter TauE/SafE family protein [Clostridia bacterium]|nr:sulfite exporter TauE/SafE family protein [Clostridia bacterium]
MKKRLLFIKNSLIGMLVGGINAFFGAGGGIVCVPLLMKLGFERKTAHANAVAVILPITFISAVNYVLRGYVSISDSLIFIPGGVIGAFLGTWLMKKLPTNIIRRVFAGFMIWAGWRLIF